MDRGAWRSMRSQSRTQLSTTTHNSSEVNTGKLYFLKKLPILSQVFKFTFKEVNKVMIISILTDLFFIDSYVVNLGFFCVFFCEGYLKSVLFEKTNLWCYYYSPFLFSSSLISAFTSLNSGFLLFFQKQIVLFYSLELDVCFIYSHSFLGFSLSSAQWREESPKVSCSPWGSWLLSPPAHNSLIRNVEVEREVNFREGLAGRGESAP